MVGLRVEVHDLGVGSRWGVRAEGWVRDDFAF